ncbi:hypothetical protein [Pseudoalteromonas phage KB12-38]|nr:hypothetical protein [Pseudoalteromonas phage KB12-38]
MSKIIVQPKKVQAFLIQPNGKEINAFRPTVVERSSFTTNMMAQEKIKLATEIEILDDATDEAFEKIYNSPAIVKSAAGDSDKQAKQAIEKFLETFAKSAAEPEETGDDTADKTTKKTDKK